MDAYSLPLIDKCLDLLARDQYFGPGLWLQAGKGEKQEKMAFTTHTGL